MGSDRVTTEELLSRAIAALGEAHVALIVALHRKGVLEMSEAREVLALSARLQRSSDEPALDEMSARVLELLLERVDREIESLEAVAGSAEALRVLRGGRPD